jgi:poly-D-alanine transfer protein DltD
MLALMIGAVVLALALFVFVLWTPAEWHRSERREN